MNNVSLYDIPRKLRELCEREQYWVTGPDGQGGISEAFAKRLFEFLKYEEGKFPFYFSHVAIFLWRGNVLSWSLKWKDDGVFCCGGKQCKFSVAEILHSYLESRRAVNLVRNMEVVDLRSLIQSCCPVPSDGRPSTSGGAGGVSSRFLHSNSGGRIVADTGVHLSANPGNVSGEELHASSSHRASTRVADLSAS